MDLFARLFKRRKRATSHSSPSGEESPVLFSLSDPTVSTDIAPEGMLPPPSHNLYRVASAEQALELAKRFQAEKKYDLFRGQRQTWPVISTICRIARSSDSELRDATAQLQRFLDWCAQEPHVANLCANDLDFTRADTFVGIAQHFGIPTPFLDFTADPEVATYFATSQYDEKAKANCIVCINRTEFEEHARAKDPTGSTLALIDVDVPDLWRLHAQKGVFVYCNGPFEDYYYFHLAWIVFPPSMTPIGGRSLESIYPPEKSHLEILFDQYCRKQKDEAAQEQFKIEFARKLAGSIKYVGFAPIETYGLKPHDSWPHDNSGQWSQTQPELWSGPPRPQRFPPFTGIALDNANEHLDTIASGVLSTMKDDSGLRARPVKWTPSPEDQNETLEEALFVLWNGIRRLPYSDEQVARSLAYCVVHFKIGYRVWPDWMEVEFSDSRLGKSRAVVSAASLQSACAYDLAELAKRIGIVLQPGMQGMRQILAHVYQPKLLFKFPEFVSVFVEQIVPYQVLTSENGGHSIIYAAGELYTFGLR